MKFKSERAAKMAYTKAEKVMEAAMTAEARRYGVVRGEPTEEERTKLDCMEAAYKAFPEGEERNAAREVYWAACDEIVNRPRVQAEAAYETARQNALAIYEAATKQGFFIKSWWFGYNPTRDLIAANID